ncbi:tautomerase family protein [Paenibacillus sp. SI8]|uniref:tautomerase family protein n=1 Tax=unclassified Paenibacillus TaxID=185978 RepID=UPI00346563B3
MPYAEISMNKNFITDEEKSALSMKLTKILIESEGLKDNPISRSIALLDIKEFDTLYVGGEKSNEDKVVIKIYGFANAFNEEIKKKLFSEITDAFIAVSDKTRLKNGRNIWCMIIPLGDFDFGVGGIPVTLELTRQLVSSHLE